MSHEREIQQLRKEAIARLDAIDYLAQGDRADDIVAAAKKIYHDEEYTIETVLDKVVFFPDGHFNEHAALLQERLLRTDPTVDSDTASQNANTFRGKTRELKRSLALNRDIADHLKARPISSKTIIALAVKDAAIRFLQNMGTDPQSLSDLIEARYGVYVPASVIADSSNWDSLDITYKDYENNIVTVVHLGYGYHGDYLYGVDISRMWD